jgi:GNAT superfamily N-acetyltransferase
MSSDWTLRYYREGDDEGILDLLVAAFGRWPGVDIDVPPIDHLRWKLSSDPIAKQVNYVAEADGRIVGCQLIFVQRLKYGERVLLADNGTDYAVHPDFQGRGLSKEIWNFDYQRFFDTFYAIISISDSPIVLHQVKTIGSGRTLANRIEWLECDTASFATARVDERLTSVSSFDQRIDNFCRDALAPFELAIVRDRTYLNWRFADPRAGRHAIRLAEEDGALLGYAVYATARGKGFIADLLVLPERLDLIRAFVLDAGRYFGERGIGRMRCWSPRRHPYRDVLLGAGFRVLRPVGQFGFGLRGRELPPRDDPHAAVHFTVGDTDIV